MDNEALLQRIKELEAQLESANKEIVAANKKTEYYMQKFYDTNIELNKALEKIAIYQEKYGIERIRQFIPKNEKIEDIIINEVEDVIKKEKTTNKGKKYKKRAFNFEKYVTEIRDIYPDETSCPICGSQLVEASTKVRYVTEVVPASIKVIKLVKHNMKCPNCNKDNNTLFYPLSNEVFPGSILTPSLAAYIAYVKYDLGVPLNHLATHITEQIGFEITKQNLANYMAKTAMLLEPVFEQMKKDLLNNTPRVIHSDETTLVVSKGEDDKRKTSYVYVYASSFYDKNQIYIYNFQESRSIDKTAKWLQDYDGYLICDNYSGYNKLKRENPNIHLQKCWAHVRRRFADIVKNLPQKERERSVAFKILNEISKLFKNEEMYKKKHLLKSEIEKRRSIDVPPIKKSLDNILTTSNPAKGSALEKAIEYMKDCYVDLFTFVENGCVEPTNNTAERAVKPFVVQRKVFQTAGSFAGAKYTTILFSIIQTCKINNIDPVKYIENTLNNLDKPLDKLVPYALK